MRLLEPRAKERWEVSPAIGTTFALVLGLIAVASFKAS